MNVTLQNVTGLGFGNPPHPPHPPCTSLGLPLYQLHLPAIEIFEGVPGGGVPAGVPAIWNIDLFLIRDDLI